MPELPEVENIRRALARDVVGHTLLTVEVHREKLRKPIDKEALVHLTTGRRVLAARRRAKYLLLDLEGEATLLVHLGMSGRLDLVAASLPLAKHDHVCFSLDGERSLRYHDPRRFGLIDAFPTRDEARHPTLRELGLEPLSAELSAASLFAMTRTSHKPIKTFLLDGKRVAGIGNIYASEALFAARLHPLAAAATLDLAACRRLCRALKVTLERAIAHGGTTLRDFRDLYGARGDFARHLRAYGRTGAPCPRCKTAIASLTQAGRSTYFCPSCQRR